jgi:hypothetical protein
LGTLVVVDMSVKHRGKVFGIAASSVATGSGSNLWIEGKSTTGLEIQATGLLNLRLF